MQSFRQHLLALAIGVAFAAPAVFARGVPNVHASGNVQGSANVQGTLDRGMPTGTGRGEDATTATSSDTHQSMSAEAKYPPGKGNWWADADTNGDGKISTEEATANAGLSSRFGIVDTNKDGFVTMDEYRAFYTRTASQGEQHAADNSAVVTRDVWGRLDLNGDGRLSAGELAADAKFNGSFSLMDTNNDGFVSQDEYRAYAKTH
jgi:Ca2+-binding EF-hand superfamily protein